MYRILFRRAMVKKGDGVEGASSESAAAVEPNNFLFKHHPWTPDK
jgi:hypothetical protein